MTFKPLYSLNLMQNQKKRISRLQERNEKVNFWSNGQFWAKREFSSKIQLGHFSAFIFPQLNAQSEKMNKPFRRNK